MNETARSRPSGKCPGIDSRAPDGSYVLDQPEQNNNNNNNKYISLGEFQALRAASKRARNPGSGIKKK